MIAITTNNSTKVNARRMDFDLRRRSREARVVCSALLVICDVH